MTPYPLTLIELKAVNELLRLGAGGADGCLLAPEEEVRPLTPGRLTKLARIGVITSRVEEGGKRLHVTEKGVESARGAVAYFADLAKARKTEPKTPELYLWLTEQATAHGVPVAEVWMLVCRLFETRRRVSEETVKTAVVAAIQKKTK